MENRINLICIPHAGGNSSCFYKWQKYLEDNINLIPIELRGRGRRLGEPLYQTMDEAIVDIFEQIRPIIKNERYILFGHSMGSCIVYSVAQMIISQQYNEPKHIVLSSVVPPKCEARCKTIHDADISVLRREVLKLGGTPREVFDNTDLASIFIPIIRADYKILETFQATELPILECDLSVFYGSREDEVILKKISLWNSYTKKQCRYYKFDGDHFYLFNESIRQVVETINLICSSLV